MKRMVCVVAELVVFAVCAAAQAPAAGQKVGLATSMQNAYATLKGNLTQAAEKMPEANYGFKPAPDPDLRTFGQWIGHQTDNQFLNCATLKGVPNPSPAQSNEKKTTKTELVKALADAFAFCDGALSSLTDQNALQLIKQGDGETARGGVASALLSHGLESYGIVVVYMRAKGVAPPAAAPAAGRGGAAGGRRGQ
jgi:DinB family protein